MTGGRVVEILLVEDNDYDAEMTLRALQKARLANDVFRVRDGAGALNFMFGTGNHLDRATASAPKVIFLDLKLPKVDGIEVLRRLKEDPRTRHVPVVAMTSSDQEIDRYETYQLGVNSYVVKPIEFDSFVSAITQVGFYWLVINKPVETAD
jgi:two-component system, response regulator